MSTELKENQEMAAEMMARGEKQSSIAYILGLCPETVSRWKHSPEFMGEIERIKCEKRQRTRDNVKHLAEAAFHAIWSELHGGPKKFQAALHVLKMLGIENVKGLDTAIEEQYAKDSTSCATSINGAPQI